MADDDRALLEAARRGDEAALEELLRRYEAQIYRYGMTMCRDPEAAKDVLQDTLLAMARSVRDFRGASSLSTWLYAIARSFCLKQRRKGGATRARERSLEGDAAVEAARVPDPGKHPDDAAADTEVGRAIERAIAALEPPHREVLILRDVEGLTAPEVAEVLGVSVDAVKSRLHRARVAVRAQLAPLLGIPEPAPDSTSACPDVLRLYSQHLEDEISRELCAEMEQHVERCARCRSACDSLKHTLALCRTASASEKVPPAVQASVRAALRALLAAG